MDREIPESIKRKRKLKTALTIAIPILAVIIAVVIIVFAMRTRVSPSDIVVGTVEQSPIEVTVDANGKVEPNFEMTVVSPVSSVIREVLCREGDVVEKGQPLLLLDTYSQENELNRLTDESAVQRTQAQQAEIGADNEVSNLRMQIRSKEMQTERLYAEYSNERKLDSIGTGTGDRVRQAELAWKTSQLELEQMRRQLANQQRSNAAASRGRSLEAGIAQKNIGLMQRTLNDARILAPQRATVTFLNTTIGASVGVGERLAVLSDLSRFRISAEISEGKGDKIGIGAPVIVRVGRTKERGRVANVIPTSDNGMLRFTVSLDNDSVSSFRSGQHAEVSVVYDSIPSCLNIPNGRYYKGPGSYNLFVETSPGKFEKRNVTLGDSSYDRVEVRSGLSRGEKVALSFPDRLEKSNSFTLK